VQFYEWAPTFLISVFPLFTASTPKLEPPGSTETKYKALSLLYTVDFNPLKDELNPTCHLLALLGKGKSVPLQAWTGPEGS